MPEVAQQPPGPRRYGGVRVVVDDHGAPVADPGAAHRRLEVRWLRQRVAAAWTRRGGKVRVQVGEDRAGQVPGAVGIDARRPAEPPAHVEQDRPDRASQRPRHGGHIGQRAWRAVSRLHGEHPLCPGLPRAAGLVGRRHNDGYHTAFVLWVSPVILWTRPRYSCVSPDDPVDNRHPPLWASWVPGLRALAAVLTEGPKPEAPGTCESQVPGPSSAGFGPDQSPR